MFLHAEFSYTLHAKGFLLYFAQKRSALKGLTLLRV